MKKHLLYFWMLFDEKSYSSGSVDPELVSFFDPFGPFIGPGCELHVHHADVTPSCRPDFQTLVNESARHVRDSSATDTSRTPVPVQAGPCFGKDWCNMVQPCPWLDRFQRGRTKGLDRASSRANMDRPCAAGVTSMDLVWSHSFFPEI